MVKSNARRGAAPSREEIDQLATQFGSRVALKDGRQAKTAGAVDFGDGGPTTSMAVEDRRGVETATPDSIPIPILPNRRPDAHGHGQARSLPEAGSSSARQENVMAFLDTITRPGGVAFDVDLTGAQSAETPFLRPILKTGQPSQPPAWNLQREMRAHLLRPRRAMTYQLFKRATRLMLIARVKDDLSIGRLIGMTPKKIVANLQVLVPHSIQEIMDRDPSGQGRVNFAVVKSWLEEHPDVATLMRLTPRTLELIFREELEKDDVVSDDAMQG